MVDFKWIREPSEYSVSEDRITITTEPRKLMTARCQTKSE